MSDILQACFGADIMYGPINECPTCPFGSPGRPDSRGLQFPSYFRFDFCVAVSMYRREIEPPDKRHDILARGTYLRALGHIG